MTGQVRQALHDYRGLLIDLAASRDGRRLIAGGSGINALIWDISLAGTAPAGLAPTPDEQAKLWGAMLDTNSETSLPAMRRLAAHPDIAVALIRGAVKPVTSAPSNALLDRLVLELGNEKFPVRETAYRQLDELGEGAVVGLKARLANAVTAEARTRLMRLLAKHDSLAPTPEMVREARTFEILEQLNSPAALALLKELAAGASNARRTRSAANVLQRVEPQ